MRVLPRPIRNQFRPYRPFIFSAPATATQSAPPFPQTWRIWTVKGGR